MALPREFMLPVLFEKLPYPYVLHFDEFELMDAFEKLAVNGELVHIEVWPGVTRESTRVRAYNDKGSIALAKTIIANK